MKLEQDRKALRFSVSRDSTKIHPLKLSIRLMFRGRHSFPAGLLVSGSLFGGRQNNALLSLLKLSKTTLPRLEKARAPFSPGYYLLTNPDVAAAGLNPWAHYHTFGRFEGRSPHPLIDPFYISERLGIPVGDAVDSYLESRMNWFVNPSAFVDIGKFVAFGPWDRKRHPLLNIIEDGLFNDPWVNFRIPLISLGTGEETDEIVGAYISLLGLNRHSPIGYEIEVSMISTTECLPFENAKEVMCIPGFVFTSGGEAHTLNANYVVSPDYSAIQTDKLLFSIVKGQRLEVGTLYILPNDLSRQDIFRTVENCVSGDAISPGTREQESLIRYLLEVSGLNHIVVLPFGQNSRLLATNLRKIQNVRRLSGQRVWRDFAEISAESTLILVEDDLVQLAEISEIQALVAEGAQLCIINSETLLAYAQMLDKAKTVVFVGASDWAGNWFRESVVFSRFARDGGLSNV